MTTVRPYGGVSAEDRAALRRDKLLSAGLAVFGSSGYRSATVRQICRTAGVADRYFYEHFTGMEDLLVAVYGMCLDRLETAVVAAISASDQIATMARQGLEGLVGVTGDDPRLARVVWFEVLGVSRRVEDTYLHRMERFADILLASAPELDDTAAELRASIASAAVGGISHVLMTWVASGCVRPRSQIVAALEIFLISVVDGVRADR
ncbi:MAG: TetR/AcrR family transcriptional regulator [Mycobacterium sp.]|nr:TetR/AcrR family transcriptional regulator [Mycobacterium sp.]